MALHRPAGGSIIAFLNGLIKISEFPHRNTVITITQNRGNQPMYRAVVRIIALSSLLALTGLGLRNSSAANAQTGSTCQALAAKSFADAKIQTATVEGPVCRIRGIATPTAQSSIHFEVWLPLSGWNGRIEMIGNGGYSPQIRFDELAALVRDGNAAVATDTGHGGEGLDFGFDNSEAIADWGHRAVHESIIAGKAIAKTFYGRSPHYAYFAGCSTGGHQALMEAQRYPADFDGILAGDPGNNRTNLNLGFLWQFLSNHPKGDNDHPILSADDLKLVNHAVTEECDAQDGVRDGIIADPRLCHFDPAELRCPAAKNTECLTETQIAALRKMYAGAHRSDTGESIYPGWPVGSEWIEGAGGWQIYWANPQKPDEPQRVDYFRRWAFHDPAWNWWAFDWAKGVDTARTRLGPLVDAVGSDLSTFRRHGGKLILYQGSADPVVSASDTVAYYDRLAGRNPDASAFVRLFMVPGMAHCAGGPGATSFNSGDDADHNIGLALRRWVEAGKAPDRIVAVKYRARTPDSGIAMSRPLCAWPKLPAYKGNGDTNDAANFICR